MTPGGVRKCGRCGTPLFVNAPVLERLYGKIPPAPKYATAGDLARLFGISHENACNRLRTLEGAGLVVARVVDREKQYSRSTVP